LIKTAEVIYLSSDTTAEKFSRNLMLVLAVLVDNINLQGKDLYEELYKTYKIKDIENIIQSSSYKNVCRNISVETLIKNDCQKRNIIDFNSEYETFRFTNAINVFLDKAVEIAHIDE
jgi:membrane-bound ClpP family serine protease